MAAKLFHKQRLLTPGPTSVPESVLLEMAQPIIHHRTKQFQAIFKDLSERLQRLYRTAGPVLSIAGSGTTAFDEYFARVVRGIGIALLVVAGAARLLSCSGACAAFAWCLGALAKSPSNSKLSEIA